MRAFVFTTLALGALCACARTEKPAPPSEAAQAPVVVNRAQLAAFAALPEVMASDQNPITQAKVDLGRRLYYETSLSSNNSISCNSCHQLTKFGVDNQRFSKGDKGQLGGRNSPSVYNAAAHIAQFWDGRAATVEEQAKGPVLNPAEMAMPNDKEVIKRLKADPTYVGMFQAAFPNEKNPVTYDNVGMAIGAFERGLVTPSRWDKYLQGDETALTNEEKIGLNAFMNAGCVGCHNGALMGGNRFQKVGVVQPWPDQADKGRINVTKNPADEMVFKVASLRNVEMTGPYFHDGAVSGLSEAVHQMARYQLGRDLTPAELNSIVTYLKALTGTMPAGYAAPPAK